jgi:hypothetical protein
MLIQLLAATGLLLSLWGRCAAGREEGAPQAGRKAAPRHVIHGTWKLTLHLQHSAEQPPAPAQDSLVAAVELSDVSPASDAEFAGVLRADFEALLRREMSCGPAEAYPVAARLVGDSVLMRIGDATADCGVNVAGIVQGDSVMGDWQETSLAGTTLSGSFVMRRDR